MNYDSHVNWRNRDERGKALKHKEILIDNNVQTISLVEFPIGPHLLPMVETHMSAANLPTMEAGLVVYRVHCSILIHEKTNDNMYDHIEGARWLGTLLELNLEFIRSLRG